jgi:hypothetical protein
LTKAPLTTKQEMVEAEAAASPDYHTAVDEET